MNKDIIMDKRVLHALLGDKENSEEHDHFVAISCGHLPTRAVKILPKTGQTANFLDLLSDPEKLKSLYAIEQLRLEILKPGGTGFTFTRVKAYNKDDKIVFEYFIDGFNIFIGLDHLNTFSEYIQRIA